ncbi:MAG: hypothetical protein JSS57_09030 [Proteobacteria bacterium]|nr:hypothetical protein [Pseudomonadota bacterium]
MRMTKSSPSIETPRIVHISTKLLWLAMALAMILQLIYAKWHFDVVLNSFLNGLILVFALHAYLIIGISRGRNSARWISLMFFVGGLFLAPPSIAAFPNAPLQVSVEVSQILSQCIAFIGLFTPPSNAWFRSSFSSRRTVSVD